MPVRMILLLLNTLKLPKSFLQFVNYLGLPAIAMLQCDSVFLIQ